MADFSKFKNSSSIDRLAKEIEKLKAPVYTEDTRYWKPVRDKSGNASAIIRFLPTPAVDGDDALPWVRIWDHGFKGPSGKWYIEKSRTTLGKDEKDPVTEYNSKLWNSTNDDNSPARKQARDQKRRLSFVSNVLVISDNKNPASEGKVFLFRYGKKIFDKITTMMKPEFEGEKPVDVFDLYKGSNFKLKMKMVSNFPNYDDSSFAEPSQINLSDKELETLWKTEYSLKELIDPKNFKSYEQLKQKFDWVMQKPATEKDEDIYDSKPSKKAESPPWANDEEDEDEDLKQFRQLAS